jgi:3-oxoacyl-[acyl-carrier protein] reductase
MPRDLLLVTGASSDLGLALIRRLVARPEPPLVIAHHHAGIERIEALRSEVGADHIRPIAADFTRPESVVALAERVEAEHGIPDQIVHLPALELVQERFPRATWERFQRDLEVQIHAAVLVLQRFLPRMARLPRARVVFVLSSVTRGVPPKFLSMYTVIKHAQLGLMKALASEYAGTHVTVNAVSPGMVETRFLDNLPEIAVQMAAKQSPLGRHATTDEVTSAIAFLLSPDASYISGAEIPITAGQTS